MSFENTKFVIIGATGGIGSALSRRLKRYGSELILIGRSTEKLSVLGEELGAPTLALDASKSADLEHSMFSSGPIHGIVNCAGSILLKPAHLTKDAEWNQTIETNLTTGYATVKAGVKAMGRAGGSIVLCSSAAARIGLANHEAIAAAKAGIIGLTLAAAATYAGRNIRINCVAPGLVDTPLTATIISNEPALKTSLSMHALGRAGNAEAYCIRDCLAARLRE